MAAFPDILERHCSEASFLWSLRDRAVRDQAYTRKTLADLDERVDANLDGLVLAKDDGWSSVKEALDEDEPGTAFTAMFVAVTTRDFRRVAHVLDIGGESPALRRAIVSALGFSSFENVNRILPGLLDPRCPPELHYVGIAACAVHRRDPMAALTTALQSNHPALRARALKAVGELGRTDLAANVADALTSADAAERFWAGWSGSLFGSREARQSLLEIAGSGPTGEPAILSLQPRACETAMRGLDRGHARDWLESKSHAATPRVLMSGAAALGDPAMLAGVLQRMTEPELARAAGEAFRRVTGVDLSNAKLRAEPPPGLQSGPTDDPDDDDVATDPDDGLPWPNPSAVEVWWASQRKAFATGERYLLGRPAKETDWLERVILSGSQADRVAAAEEMLIAQKSVRLAEVRARSNARP